jgi:hypothetical protein
MHSTAGNGRPNPLLSIKTPHKFYNSSSPSSPRASEGTHARTSKKTHQSPYRYVTEFKLANKLSSPMQTYLSKLICIFMYYTSFGDKLNISSLKSTKFHKLLSDAQIEKESSKINYDLLFSKLCKSGSLNFQQFLESLVKVSSLCYPNVSVDISMEKLINEHINPLYKGIDEFMKSSTFGYINENIIIPSQIIMVIELLDKPLYRIYSTFFAFELSSSLAYEQRYEQSMAAMYDMLTNFDICPMMISKPSAFYIFQSVINSNCDQFTPFLYLHKETGGLFMYNRFIELLVKIAVASKLFGDLNMTGLILKREIYQLFGENRDELWLHFLRE